jgi:excisionase family DNA binding protein
MATPASVFAETHSNSAYLTKREAADYLKVSPRYIERAINDGRLRAYKPSLRTVRFRRADLESFMDSVCTFFVPKKGGAAR